VRWVSSVVVAVVVPVVGNRSESGDLFFHRGSEYDFVTILGRLER
jgi:hypothetical protein